jgi:hypothetical protein
MNITAELPRLSAFLLSNPDFLKKAQAAKTNKECKEILEKALDLLSNAYDFPLGKQWKGMGAFMKVFALPIVANELKPHKTKIPEQFHHIIDMVARS